MNLKLLCASFFVFYTQASLFALAPGSQLQVARPFLQKNDQLLPSDEIKNRVLPHIQADFGEQFAKDILGMNTSSEISLHYFHLVYFYLIKFIYVPHLKDLLNNFPLHSVSLQDFFKSNLVYKEEKRLVLEAMRTDVDRGEAIKIALQDVIDSCEQRVAYAFEPLKKFIRIKIALEKFPRPTHRAITATQEVSPVATPDLGLGPDFFYLRMSPHFYGISDAHDNVRVYSVHSPGTYLIASLSDISLLEDGSFLSVKTGDAIGFYNQRLEIDVTKKNLEGPRVALLDQASFVGQQVPENSDTFLAPFRRPSPFESCTITEGDKVSGKDSTVSVSFADLDCSFLWSNALLDLNLIMMTQGGNSWEAVPYAVAEPLDDDLDALYSLVSRASKLPEVKGEIDGQEMRPEFLYRYNLMDHGFASERVSLRTLFLKMLFSSDLFRFQDGLTDLEKEEALCALFDIPGTDFSEWLGTSPALSLLEEYGEALQKFSREFNSWSGLIRYAESYRGIHKNRPFVFFGQDYNNPEAVEFFFHVVSNTNPSLPQKIDPKYILKDKVKTLRERWQDFSATDAAKEISVVPLSLLLKDGMVNWDVLTVVCLLKETGVDVKVWGNKGDFVPQDFLDLVKTYFDMDFPALQTDSSSCVQIWAKTSAAA